MCFIINNLKQIQMIREMFEDMPIVSSIIAIFILGIAFILIDGIASKPKPFYGSVIDKHYKAERNSTGTGYGMTSGGSSGVIITSEHESGKFLLMVKTESGEVVTVECEPELYYEKQIGQKIDCNAYKGLLTGWTWSMYGVR
jgi:hypothetical protein